VNPILPHPQTVVPDVPPNESDRTDGRRSWMPKMDFPHFDGADARIWLEKCEAYFALKQIPLGFRVSAASIHMVLLHTGFRLINRHMGFSIGNSLHLQWCLSLRLTLIGLRQWSCST
jgi:hypothetical protein